jgi:AAA domain-containing protein
MVDESSLASTRQMQAFMEKIGPQDRVLLVGDTRQHQGVDAGKPFEQMQQAGMQTSQLDQIMRQKDPELLRVVEHFAKNETATGISLLQLQGRVVDSLTDQHRSLAFHRASACIVEEVFYRHGEVDVSVVRADLCGIPCEFVPSSHLREVTVYWRMVQMRQLFRLALEALLHWATVMVSEKPQHTSKLVQHFLRQAGSDIDVASWLKADDLKEISIPDRIGLLQDALGGDVQFEKLALNIREALAVSLSESFEDIVVQSTDRLPLSRAKEESDSFSEGTTDAFMTHVLSSWIFGQHVYWSVGRGLGDARGRGKTILRLKVVPEESGWTLAPGTNLRSSPRATPDRLDTAVSLMQQAGFFDA